MSAAAFTSRSDESLIRATERDYSVTRSYSLTALAEGGRRKRKLVTVVFCDLVRLTSQAEAMAPEDVDAMLGPYHERLRDGTYSDSA
jgi:class 3 adenylate cyclase